MRQIVHRFAGFQGLSYRELQAEAKARGLKANGATDALMSRLTEYESLREGNVQSLISVAAKSDSTIDKIFSDSKATVSTSDASPIVADCAPKCATVSASTSAKLNYFDLTLPELEIVLASWGQPTYRAKQVKHHFPAFFHLTLTSVLLRCGVG